MKLLFLGNSITLHAPAPDIGWNGNWGMAASCRENDYVHRLEQKLRDAGKETELRIRFIVNLEREPETYPFEELSEDREWKPDVVILRVCENTPKEKMEAFGKAYRRLIAYFACSAHKPVIFAVGPFWKNDRAEELIRQAAQAFPERAFFLSLSPLHSREYTAAGLFTHGGVASHPSDRGMEEIASILFEGMVSAGLLRKAVPVPVPEGEAVSDAYRVLLDGEPADCYTCRVSAVPFNRSWPGHQRSLDQTELAAFLSFSMTAPAELCVTADRDFDEVRIRPLSKGIVPHTEGRTIRFTISEPGQYSVELDGRHRNLHIFADPARDFSAEREKATYVFGPGIHDAGMIELRSGESVFLDAGAVVHGSIRAEKAENIGVYGYGILDYSTMERHVPLEMTRDGLINFVECENVKMEGIILRDSSWFNVTAFNCRNLLYENVKVIGCWRYNSDGFDFINSQNVRVSNCFLRTFDDTVVLKGWRTDGAWYEKMNVENYVIENCVLWCDWGGAMEIGAETVADEYAGILFRNCDVIHNSDGGMRIQSGDRAYIHDVRYENIRVEYSRYDRANAYQSSEDAKYDPPDVPNCPNVIKNFMYCGMWTEDQILGNVRDVSYRNIEIFAD